MDLVPGRSEWWAKLLIVQQANRAKNSECSLIYQYKLVDFDSAIPRFESWRPSQIKALKGCSGRALLCKPKYWCFGTNLMSCGANRRSGWISTASTACCLLGSIAWLPGCSTP